MKNFTIKALMLLTLAIPSLHGAASWQRLSAPARTYAGTYWQRQAPRFFSSSLPGYAARSVDEIKAAEKAQQDTLENQFYKQYLNTAQNKVAGGIYKDSYGSPLLLDFPVRLWTTEFTKNARTKMPHELARSYANIMMNKELTPQQSQLALKELAKEQGKTFAAGHQMQTHYRKMKDLLSALTESSKEPTNNIELSLRYAQQKQFGYQPGVYRSIMNYINQHNIAQDKLDIWNRTPEQRELMDLLKD